jgi:hypothetical protein
MGEDRLIALVHPASRRRAEAALTIPDEVDEIRESRLAPLGYVYLIDEKRVMEMDDLHVFGEDSDG